MKIYQGQKILPGSRLIIAPIALLVVWSSLFGITAEVRNPSRLFLRCHHGSSFSSAIIAPRFSSSCEAVFLGHHDYSQIAVIASGLFLQLLVRFVVVLP